MHSKCHRDKDRLCNHDCAAYFPEEHHGTHCLELSTERERLEREKSQIISRDLNTFWIKQFVETLAEFGGDLKKALKL